MVMSVIGRLTNDRWLSGPYVGGDARMAEKRLTCLLAKKWHEEYLEIVGFVRSQMSLVFVKSITLLLELKWVNLGLLGQRFI